MVKLSKWLSGFAAVAIIFGVPVVAQTQEQFDRVEKLARFTVALPACEQIGMRVTLDAEKFEAAAKEEALSRGMAVETFQQAYGAAIDRQGRIFQIDSDTFLNKLDQVRDAGFNKAVRTYISKYGKVCLEAAGDPIFSQIVAVPPAYDLEVATTEAADKLLKNGGYASWQTPAIQARGDLMMAAGACRSHIGAARSDAIFQKYSHADIPREREYYVHSFDEGLSDTSFNFDAGQCERLIKRLMTKAEAKK